MTPATAHLKVYTERRAPRWTRFRVVRRSDGALLAYCSDEEAAARLVESIGPENCSIEAQGRHESEEP